MNYPEFKEAIESLENWAWKAGYYNAQGEFNNEAEAGRNLDYLRGRVLAAYHQLCEELDDLEQACDWIGGD